MKITELTKAAVIDRDMQIPISLFGQNMRITVGQIITKLGLIPVYDETAGKLNFATADGEKLLDADIVIPKNPGVDRGLWKQGETYYAGTLNPDTNRVEVSYVWYFGCKFRCLVTGTTDAPTWDSADWEFVEGNPGITLDFTDRETVVTQADPKAKLEVTAAIYNQDVTADSRVKWTWERESWRGTVKDTTADTLWNNAHATGATNTVDLDAEDMNFQFGAKPDKLLYRVTATLLTADGVPVTDENGNPVTQQAEFSI